MPETQESLTVLSASISDRGLSEKRPQNEDSFLVVPRCGIYAVADGVGGAQAGEVASQMAVEILGEAFTNRQPSQDPESVMQAAISHANAAIFQMAHELPQLANMATTIVALHIEGNIATIGHVGDSRLYRVDPDGRLTAETDDHSVVAEEVRAGRMTAEQAANHPGRNVISRALGADPSVDVDLKTIMIDPGTSFLLCSDGITRHVTDAEIKGVLTFGGSPDEVCEYLKRLCFERGAEDNLTAVVIKTSRDAGAESIQRQPLEPVAEEDTVATARSISARPHNIDESFDESGDLLELEPLADDRRSAVHVSIDETDDTGVESETAVTELPPVVPAPEPVRSVEIEDRPVRGEREFSMFGSGANEAEPARQSSGWKSVMLALAMLTLGSVIGIFVYNYVLSPPAQPANNAAGPLSVMRAEDIAFASFERIRRTVDADPAAFVRELPQPDDAEDFYLLGRAHLLLGEYPQAQLALIEAQKRLAAGATENANARVLRADIATALAITNDPNPQRAFRQQFDAVTPAAAPNSSVR